MNPLSRLLHSIWNSETGAGKVSASFSQIIPPERLRELGVVSNRLGYAFRFPGVLDCALTHRSYANISQVTEEALRDYESLEFLGDAVLGFVISEALLVHYPQLDEGELTKMKASLVSTGQLFSLSESLGLGQYILLSPGEAKTGGRGKSSILADVFESVVAAIYLDGGMTPARQFILAQFEGLLESAGDEIGSGDFKSRLQEHLHSVGGSSPSYLVLSEEGPDHHKQFRVEVRTNGQALAEGTGTSKKMAEKDAAEKALRSLGVIE
jgi:ribonuclease-3